MSNIQGLSHQLCDTQKFIISFHFIEHDSNNFEFISTCDCFKLFIINVVSDVIDFHQVIYAHFDVTSRANVLIYFGSIFWNTSRYLPPPDFLIIVCAIALVESIISNRTP
jgi:hypothetical protein